MWPILRWTRCALSCEWGGFLRALQDEGDRAVIHQGYLHIGLKDPALHRHAEFAHFRHEVGVKAVRLFGGGRRIKRWAPSFAAVSRQGELRDREDAASLLRQREIHLPRFILEDPQVDNLLSHPFRL